ncbi:MAG: hypothetical protein MUC83_02075 [Pirellula sp.]|jgi:predicted CXXCH cytochrome family protein|nr:hypothetical protein [Pirellula sp.]
MWDSTLEVENDDDRAWAKGEKHVVPGKNRVLTAARDRDGLVIHSETMYDESGNLIYEQPHKMDYVIGSGQRAKAYIRQVGERLYVSPLNWYQRDDIWALAPGYRLDDIRRFQRRVDESCLGCHSGFLNVLPDGEDRFASPPFHERSIGCERCHGEGANHVVYQSSDDSSKPTKDSIVNPSKLTIEQREAVCYQCHLEARARVLRPGKKHLDFRPGMMLSDVWAIIDYGTEVSSDGKTRSVNHVQQMRDSTCYIKSQQQMGCISCHDPHSTPSPETKVEFYRNRCNNCHSGEAQNKTRCLEAVSKRELVHDDCVTCHMPSLSSSNMSHVAQTDHRILRQPRHIAADATGPSSLSFFDNQGDRFPESERQRNLALGTVIHCQRRGIAIPDSVYSFLVEIAKTRSNDAPLFATLGALAQSKNDIVRAREFYQSAIRADPDFDAALDGLFDIAFVREDWQSCLDYSNKLLKSEPRYGRVIAMRGEAFARLGQIDNAINEWEKAVDIDPGFTALRQMLFDAYSQQGNQSKAEFHAAMLRKLQSATIPHSVKNSE